MLSYQDTVNQDLTERSLAIVDSLEDNEELNALIQERFMSYPTNFSRNFLSDSLLFNSDKFANCAETVPRGGVFYGTNAEPRSIKNEDFVDISRLLFDNSDESAIPANQIAGDIDIDLFDHRKGVDNNQFIYKNNNNNDIDTNKNEYTRLNCVKSVSDRDGFNSGFQSARTSTSTSPTNVPSMDSIKQESYYLTISPESTTDGVHFLNDPFNYETMLGDDRLPFYTPDNSCGPIDITDSKNKKPMLTLLNLKGSFVNDDEINTPNIIDTIMEASEQQPLFLKENDIFDEVAFLSASPQEMTPCPSTSSPAAVSDTTVDVDGFLSAVTSPITSLPPVRRPGRPRKRRHDSDYETPEDDDDDDYLPPTHQQRRKYKETRIAKKKFVYEDISEDEDDDDSRSARNDLENRLKSTIAIEDELLRISKRGRPPKHTRSISSDDYSCLDPDEARYREMRDRNNEASRKSRYKRKQKEMKMSDELEDLEMDNVKLKTQVEELQKTVDRYRDNLMKVMLSGKK